MSNSAVPPRLYTNQSETVNSILSAKKTALGYKKKEDISKFTFIKKIFLASVDQRREIEKALVGQSSEYRLNKNAEYLQVPLETWTNLSKLKRREYLDFVTHLSKDEIKNMKTITASFWEKGEHSIEPSKTSLSVKLSEHLNILHADNIEQKALDLLNDPSAISLSPSLLARNKEKVYLVAAKTNKEIHNVIVNENGMVKCNCRGYKFTKICSHSVAISEKEDILRNHVAKVKGCRSRAAITYTLSAKGSGKKGGQKRRERSYKDKPFQEGNAITAN